MLRMSCRRFASSHLSCRPGEYGNHVGTASSKEATHCLQWNRHRTLKHGPGCGLPARRLDWLSSLHHTRSQRRARAMTQSSQVSKPYHRIFKCTCIIQRSPSMPPSINQSPPDATQIIQLIVTSLSLPPARLLLDDPPIKLLEPTPPRQPRLRLGPHVVARVQADDVLERPEA